MCLCIRLRSTGLKNDETKHSSLTLVLGFLHLSTTSSTMLGRVLTVGALTPFQLTFSACPVLKATEKQRVREVLTDKQDNCCHSVHCGWM